MRLERRFNRSFDALRSIFAFTEGFLENDSIPEASRFAVNFAIEEVFTNMVKYHPDATHDICIALERLEDGVRIRITDYDVEPFDVTEDRAVDTGATLDERRVGGLGLHLMKKIMDTVDYEYVDRCSTVVMTKRLG